MNRHSEKHHPLLGRKPAAAAVDPVPPAPAVLPAPAYFVGASLRDAHNCLGQVVTFTYDSHGRFVSQEGPTPR
jgi:hypothetical protein